MDNEISNEYLPTIGSNTKRKEYILKKQDIKIRVNIWDFGGQRSFNPFNPILFKNVDVALLVFDLSKPKETLESIKQEFFENIQKYSEDFISIIVGNKLDLLLEGEKVKSTINCFLNKRDHIMLTSAKTRENIDECFELLIHTYLRKTELIDPDTVPNNTAKNFLELIGKNEKELKALVINVTDIDSVLTKYKQIPKEKDENIEEKEIHEIKYYDFLKQEIEKNALHKNEVMDQFLINLSELDKTINHIKKTYSKSAIDLINNLKNLFITTKKDFEVSVDTLSKLNIEEFELVNIISKVKDDQS